MKQLSRSFTLSPFLLVGLLKHGADFSAPVAGVRVLSEPSETHYPSYDGTDMIRVIVSVLQDSDGISVEVNQMLDELH